MQLCTRSYGFNSVSMRVCCVCACPCARERAKKRYLFVVFVCLFFVLGDSMLVFGFCVCALCVCVLELVHVCVFLEREGWISLMLVVFRKR
jgi:hypothetical protein